MWKDLTMQQKSDLMDIFLSHGVTSLDEMRSFYDSNGYSSGGSGNRYSGEDTPTQQMNYSYTKPLDNVYVDSEGNLLDPNVPRARGTVRLPEAVVTARDPRKPVPTAFDRHEDWLRPMMDFVPGLGDVLQAKDAVTDAANGNYLSAGLNAGMLLLPNILEKPLKYLYKGAKRLSDIRDAKKFLGDISDAEWDDAYFAAINAGDMDAVQQLRDMHFMAKTSGNKMPSPEGWHQTNTDFNAFEIGRNNNKDIDALGISGIYTKNTNADILGTQYPIQMHIYRNAANPLRISQKTDLLDIVPGLKDKISTYKEIYDRKRGLFDILQERSNPNITIERKKEIASQIKKFQEDYQKQLSDAVDANKAVIDKYLKDNGYDAVLIDKDYSGNGLFNFGRHTDTEVMLSPGQIKSANGITYDDAGNIIPLSQRDNFSKNDIRYSWMLPMIGVGAGTAAYGTQDNDGNMRAYGGNLYGGDPYSIQHPSWGYNTSTIFDFYK